MSAYDYIKSDGSAGTVEAASPELALKNAPGIGENSGVKLTTVSGGPASGSTGTGTTTTTTDSSNSNTLLDRYKSDRGAIDQTYGIIPAPNQDNIRAQNAAAAQSTINAINSKYASIEADDRSQVDLMNREQRAANVMNGLSGGSVGSSKTIETAGKGAALEARTAAAKNAEISAVLSNAETRSTDQFKAERDSYISQQKDKLAAEQALNDKISTTAKTELTTLASGMSYDDFKTKSPALLQQYMKELNTDENGLKAIFLAGQKKSLISDTPQIIGNQAIWFSQGPDGKITSTSVAIPGGSKTIKDSRITNDGIQVLYTDGTYETIGGAKLGKPSDTPGGKKSGSSATFTPTQTNTGAANAGLPIDEFKNLDPDTKNYFVNGYSKFDTLLKKVNAGTMDASDLKDLVDTSATIPSAAKKALLGQIPDGNSSSNSSGEGVSGAWDSVRSFFHF